MPIGVLNEAAMPAPSSEPGAVVPAKVETCASAWSQLTSTSVTSVAAVPLPYLHLDEGIARIRELPTDTPLAFLCHHGSRSQEAAEHFRELGYREVYNIEGGIEAWAEAVDPSVPRY